MSITIFQSGLLSSVSLFFVCQFRTTDFEDFDGNFSYSQSFAKRILSGSQTYIFGHYNPSVRIIDIISHNTYVVFC